MGKNKHKKDGMNVAEVGGPHTAHEYFIPKAPKEVEDLIIHKGPREYRLSPEEQERRTKQILAVQDRQRAIFFLAGSLIPFITWILSL